MSSDVERHMRKAKRPLHWPATDTFSVAAAGASYYRGAIEAISGNPDGELALVLCTATLMPEDNNAADPNAVAIYIAEKKVGHLDRQLAQDLRQHLLTQGIPVQTTTCDAAITGGLRAPEKEYSYTIELDLPLPLSLPDCRKPTCSNVVRSSPAPIFYWREPGWCLVETRMPFHARADHDPYSVNYWTTEEWSTVNFYLSNSRGIGLGHKLFGINKAEIQEKFGEIPDSRIKLISGSLVLTELKKVK